MTIRNNRRSTLQVVYLETMPWLVQFYLHTLRISVNGDARGESYLILGPECRD